MVFWGGEKVKGSKNIPFVMLFARLPQNNDFFILQGISPMSVLGSFTVINQIACQQYVGKKFWNRLNWTELLKATQPNTARGGQRGSWSHYNFLSGGN